MTELMGWNFIGKCPSCGRQLYKKRRRVRPYPFNPKCNCEEIHKKKGK